MSRQLTPQHEALVEQIVATGDFGDADQVIDEALRLLEERHRQLQELRAKLQVGLDQADRGELAEWTPELRQQLRQSAHRRAQMGEMPDPDVCS